MAQGKLEVENLLDLMNNTPTPPWILGGVLPEQAIVMVSGLGHTGKTFLALDAALSVATGAAWMGHFPTRYGRALYVGEDSSRSDVVRQMRKLLVGRGMASDPPSEDLLFTVCKGAMLTSDEQAARVADLVYRTEPALLVLDSLRFLTPGVDEDSSTEMSQVMDRVKALRDLGPAILLLHHNSLGGRARGSTAIFDAVDGAINLTHDKRTDQVKASIQKRRCIEVPDFGYHHLWDETSAAMHYIDVEALEEMPEAAALLALFVERKELTTAEAVACVKANARSGKKVADVVWTNRAARLLQRLKKSGKVEKTRHGEWKVTTKGAEVRTNTVV